MEEGWNRRVCPPPEVKPMERRRTMNDLWKDHNMHLEPFSYGCVTLRAYENPRPLGDMHGSLR